MDTCRQQRLQALGLSADQVDLALQMSTSFEGALDFLRQQRIDVDALLRRQQQREQPQPEQPLPSLGRAAQLQALGLAPEQVKIALQCSTTYEGALLFLRQQGIDVDVLQQFQQRQTQHDPHHHATAAAPSSPAAAPSSPAAPLGRQQRLQALGLSADQVDLALQMSTSFEGALDFLRQQHIDVDALLREKQQREQREQHRQFQQQQDEQHGQLQQPGVTALPPPPPPPPSLSPSPSPSLARAAPLRALGLSAEHVELALQCSSTHEGALAFLRQQGVTPGGPGGSQGADAFAGAGGRLPLVQGEVIAYLPHAEAGGAAGAVDTGPAALAVSEFAASALASASASAASEFAASALAAASASAASAAAAASAVSAAAAAAAGGGGGTESAAHGSASALERLDQLQAAEQRWVRACLGVVQVSGRFYEHSACLGVVQVGGTTNTARA
jgi:hypothetical protein